MAVTKWEVWDTLNAEGVEDDFWTIEADDAQEAALEMAELGNGLADGQFVDCPQPIAVRNPVTGNVRVFDVRAEMVATFRATERPASPDRRQR